MTLQILKILVETVVFYFIVDTVLLFGNLVSEPPNFQTVYLHNRFINFNNPCKVWKHRLGFLSTKFGSYSATIDHDILQSLVFYFIVDTVYNVNTPIVHCRWEDKT